MLIFLSVEELREAMKQKLANCELTDDQLLFVIEEDIKDYQNTFGKLPNTE